MKVFLLLGLFYSLIPEQDACPPSPACKVNGGDQYCQPTCSCRIEKEGFCEFDFDCMNDRFDHKFGNYNCDLSLCTKRIRILDPINDCCYRKSTY